MNMIIRITEYGRVRKRATERKHSSENSERPGTGRVGSLYEQTHGLY